MFRTIKTEKITEKRIRLNFYLNNAYMGYYEALPYMAISELLIRINKGYTLVEDSALLVSPKSTYGIDENSRP
jgi:hypothetical protein